MHEVCDDATTRGRVRLGGIAVDVLVIVEPDDQRCDSDTVTDSVAGYWSTNPGEEEGLDGTRFSPAIAQSLREIGWYEGRDVRDRVEAWVRQGPFWRWRAPTRPLLYALTPAALNVLREFGGIVNNPGDPGRTAARTPFRIYPVTGDEDLDRRFGQVLRLGEYIEKRVFQVGEVDNGMGALVVDDDGEVYLVGSDNLYAGKNIDEALAALLEGHSMGPA